jgi:tetratricopeptide (TPR) repeat protein
MDHCDSALALAPRAAEAYVLRAKLWRDSGLPHMGLPDAQRAAYYAPASPSAANTLGMLLHRMSQYDAAALEYERVLTLDPAASYALNNLCALRLEERRPKEAEGLCRRALALDPGLRPAQENLRRARTLLSLNEEILGGRH